MSSGASAPDLTLGSCATGIQPTASGYMPGRFRDFNGFAIERREAGTGAWSVILRKAYDPRGTYATATVCDPLPADGRTFEYGPRTYDTAGTYLPYSDVVAMTLPVG